MEPIRRSTVALASCAGTDGTTTESSGFEVQWTYSTGIVLLSISHVRI
jgi:hypothetical protein